MKPGDRVRLSWTGASQCNGVRCRARVLELPTREGMAAHFGSPLARFREGERFAILAVEHPSGHQDAPQATMGLAFRDGQWRLAAQAGGPVFTVEEVS